MVAKEVEAEIRELEAEGPGNCVPIVSERFTTCLMIVSSWRRMQVGVRSCLWRVGGR